MVTCPSRAVGGGFLDIGLGTPLAALGETGEAESRDLESFLGSDIEKPEKKKKKKKKKKKIIK